MTLVVIIDYWPTVASNWMNREVERSSNTILQQIAGSLVGLIV